MHCVAWFEKIIEKVSSCKIFSVWDLYDAYLQIPLSSQSHAEVLHLYFILKYT